MEKPEHSSKKPGRASRKAEIIAATEALVRSKGLANATTRAIASAAGCSEGAIYVHFPSRSLLLLAVLEASLPDMLIPLRALESAVGRGTPVENLRKALAAIFVFQQRVTPLVCALFSEPKLLMEYRKLLLRQHKGPQGAIGRIRKYIQAEQKLGRISSDVVAEVAATSLMANAFFNVFIDQFMGQSEPFDRYSRKLLAQTLDPFSMPVSIDSGGGNERCPHPSGTR